MAYFRVRLDVVLEAIDETAASDEVAQLMDTIPEPDPPILAVYQAARIDRVHRGPEDNHWAVVPPEDQADS